MKITMTLLDGSKIHHNTELTSVSIGRSESAQFCVHADALSRHHALVENEKGIYFVTDLKSSNGVFIDGKRIEPNVKTTFSTFQTLSFGPIDCHVQDSDLSDPPSETMISPVHTVKDFKNETRTRIHIDQKGTKPLFKKAKKENSSFSLIFIFIVCGAAFYFYKSTKAPEHSSEEALPVSSAPVARVRPPPLVPIPPEIKDEFLERSVYEERYTKRTCMEYVEVCDELKLDEKDMEGVLEREGEYFVYMKSSKRSSQTFLALETDVSRPDIVSLYTILKSNFYNQLMTNKVFQIHLLLLSDENKLYRAYRFKKNHLGQSRMELLNGIRGAITTKNSEAFWIMAHERIPALDLKP